ncbi:thioredoxin domain-containing protein [Actinomadura macrotermitis]|uniref:Thioredoxin n=1 Tax=Actinomadura macrotermitis TaxID=2585200 RepID=A0A7K0BRE0_9ACTN|nr:thioredoxin domain-containing protein [Actinomadura macrotermitis]MQY03763.1 hypothetical protein [Actinomadura macrotermitis]
MIAEVSKKDEFAKLINGDKYTLAMFDAAWVGPSRQIAPVVEKLAKEHQDIHFIKVDVDDAAELAQEAGIRAMPTFILFRQGVKVDELVGANENGLKTLVTKAEAD